MATLYELLTPLLTYESPPEEENINPNTSDTQKPGETKFDSSKTDPKQPKQPKFKKNPKPTKKTSKKQTKKVKKTKKKSPKTEKVTRKNFV